MGYTSWQVRERYNQKTYSRITVKLKKELVKEFDEAIKKDNLTRTEFVRRAINQYLDSKQSE